MEGGKFEYPQTYIGWTSKMGGKSKTPGGPSGTSIMTIWKLPGLEVALAKALNAHVVKATYVVTLGTATADRSRGLFARIEEGKGSAHAELGLLEDQSRIAFRTPNGNAKWQKVAQTKMAPPKDGDVVVRLAAPLAGGSDLFQLTSTSNVGGGLFHLGPDFQFLFTATLTDPVKYKTRVDAMIANASQAMVTLVKP
jgi:hypothetical protein